MGAGLVYTEAERTPDYAYNYLGWGGAQVTPILQIRKLRLRAEVTCTMSHSQETEAGCEPIFQTPRPTYGLLARARGLLGMVGT